MNPINSTPITLPIPCLLWDIDGTLIDTTALIVQSLDYIYNKYYGRSLPLDEIRGLIGTPLKKQVRILGDLEAMGLTEQTLVDDFIQYYEANNALETILEPVTSILIEGKKSGYPTALVTSKNHSELANTLPRLGIADFVDFAITADDVKIPKPSPEGLTLALTRFEIDPAQRANALYIGDTVYDMRAASGAGVCGVGVTWGAASREQLEAAGAVFICERPEELRRLIFGK